MGTPALSPTETLTKRVETLEVRLNDALGHLAELEQLLRVSLIANTPNGDA